jgi:hypothetical protein
MRWLAGAGDLRGFACNRYSRGYWRGCLNVENYHNTPYFNAPPKLAATAGAGLDGGPWAWVALGIAHVGSHWLDGTQEPVAVELGNARPDRALACQFRRLRWGGRRGIHRSHGHACRHLYGGHNRDVGEPCALDKFFPDGPVGVLGLGFCLWCVHAEGSLSVVRHPLHGKGLAGRIGSEGRLTTDH